MTPCLSFDEYGWKGQCKEMLRTTTIENAKVRDKPYLIPDDDGLYLKILISGRKTWVIRYWKDGREIKKTLGVYPLMSLSEARQKRDEIKNALKAGEPVEAAPVVTFKQVADEWYNTVMEGNRADDYLYTIRLRLAKLGDLLLKPIDKITRQDCYLAVAAIAATGKLETAKRTAIIVGQVFDFAVTTGRCPLNVAGGLNRGLAPSKKTHYAAVTQPDNIGKLLRALPKIDRILYRLAIQFLALTLVRSRELRYAEWGEFDLNKRLWSIPAGHTKRLRDHLVPLSRQAVEILEEVRNVHAALEINSPLVFPSIYSNDLDAFGGPLSKGILLTTLQRLYKKLKPEERPTEQMTIHGFRATGSTFLNEHGWPPDVIERQLAHAQEDLVRAAYNRAEYLDERTRMMQWYADALDALKKGAPLPPKE